MHPTLEQLITLADDAAASVEDARHVSQCGDCQRRLGEIRDLRQRLRSLPPVNPPAESWQRILARRDAPHPRLSHRAYLLAAAAAAAGLALAALLWLNTPDGREADPQPLADTTGQGPVVAPDVVSEELARLQQRARYLDAALRRLPQRQVMRVSTASTIARLEDELLLIDAQLRAAVALTPQQAERLWKARVELMNSLYEVRYANAATF